MSLECVIGLCNRTVKLARVIQSAALLHNWSFGRPVLEATVRITCK